MLTHTTKFVCASSVAFCCIAWPLVDDVARAEDAPVLEEMQQAQPPSQPEISPLDSEPGNVTERAVPGLTLPQKAPGGPTVPSVPPGRQPIPQPIDPQKLSSIPFKTSAGCPPPAGPTGIDATNALMACPWAGLSQYRVQESERNIQESLEGKRLVHGGGKLSVKGNSLAEWGVTLKMTNVRANLDFSAPPGFRSASPNGFVLEAPWGGPGRLRSEVRSKGERRSRSAMRDCSSGTRHCFHSVSASRTFRRV